MRILTICFAVAVGLCQEPRAAVSPSLFTAELEKGRDTFSIRAASFNQSGNSVNLRSVEITSGSVLIRADSADFDPATGQLNPHGKVTVSFRKVARGVPSQLLPR